jgi:hypothetical protein
VSTLLDRHLDTPGCGALLLLDNVRATAAPRLPAWLRAPGRTAAPPWIRATPRHGGASPDDASCPTRDDGRGNVSARNGASPWHGPAPWHEPDDVSWNAGACSPRSPRCACLVSARPLDPLLEKFRQQRRRGGGGGQGRRMRGTVRTMKAEKWVKRIEIQQSLDWPWSLVPCRDACSRRTVGFCWQRPGMP